MISEPATIHAHSLTAPLQGRAFRQLVCDALQHLSPAHRTVLVETFYRGGNTATVARRLGIPNGTARSRLHYALDAMRQHLQDQDATACR